MAQTMTDGYLIRYARGRTYAMSGRLYVSVPLWSRIVAVSSSPGWHLDRSFGMPRLHIERRATCVVWF